MKSAVDTTGMTRDEAVAAHRAYRRAYAKAYRLAHYEKSLAYNREWRRQRRMKDPEGMRRAERSTLMRSQYGITLDIYDAMLAKQGGVCAICQRPERFTNRGRPVALAVDHDHSCCSGQKSCGKCVRGLLCKACNQLIGTALDDQSTLTNALAYLAVWQS